MTDLEIEARMIAARLLTSAGERHFENSRVFEDLVEMVKEAVVYERIRYLGRTTHN